MATPGEFQNPRTSTGSSEGPGETLGNDEMAIREKIGEWAERLLQLDRRNNLLYFKPGRSAVGIVVIAPDAIDAQLRRSRKGLVFPYAPPAPRRRGFDVQNGPDLADTPNVRPGDLETDCEPADLQRRLGNLRRKDREWAEEQGLNVLFLTAGFLNWVDQDGELARSPLVLIPCDLERTSPRDPFRLVREEDDISDNPTLRYQLARLGIDLPEFGSESADAPSIEEYIDSVGEIIGDRDDWSVDYDIFLGTFSYSKLAMHQDLIRMKDEGPRTEHTRLLAGAKPGSGRRLPYDASAMPRDSDLLGGRLDDLLDIRDQYTVLPGDFSQLRAIEQARRGENLVIHGPPGTGKSQTIANLIATLLAEGKRVLFVSEKTAALDVVKRRLEECGLGAFCLDLHSDRARKSEVYLQLKGALEDDRPRLAASVPIEELVVQRDRLNRVVRLLHERREPLGKSVYEVQGLFANCQHMPRLEALHLPPIPDLTMKWVREAESAAERIARRPEEFRSHNSSRWLPLQVARPSLQLADGIRQDMNAVQSAINTLRAEAGLVTEWLGLPATESAGDVLHVVRLLRHLAISPTVPRSWLSRDAVVKLRRLSQQQATQQHERRRLERSVYGWFGSSPPTIDYRSMAAAIEFSPSESEAVEMVLGTVWRTALGKDPSEVLERVVELATALDSLVSDADAIAKPLAEERLDTLGQLEWASDWAARILAIDPVPHSWLRLWAIDELERESRDAKALLERMEHDEGRLGENFSDSLVELVDEDMLVRYRADHQSFWRRLGGAYRRDQRTLRGQLKTPRKLSFEESLAAVELAVEVKRQRKEWRDTETRLRDSLGLRFQGRGTNWQRTLKDLAALRDIRADWRGDADVLYELIAEEHTGERRRALELANLPVQDHLERYGRTSDAIGHSPLSESNLELAKANDVARRALVPLRRVRDATAELYRSIVTPPADVEELNRLTEDGVKLMAVTEEDDRFAPNLAQDFGVFFQRDMTDWDAVSNALRWTADLLEAANGRVSGTLADHAASPRTSEEYEGRVRSLSEGISLFEQELRILDARFNISATDWDSWDASRFSDLEAWSADLRENAGDALAWAEYRNATRELDEQLGDGAADALHAATERAEDAPDTVRRHIYAAWLDATYDAEPELREFSRIDHESMRARFRELDEQFPVSARQRVRERVFDKYPDKYATSLQSGQLGTLRGELSKRRRQMPVRRLIERIPNLLQMLKPCFLMSPLAVSQYLPAGPLASNHLDFDVVIFDEASQVLPWDALPAIDRARQAIVVGDRQQLPPTTFFQRDPGDDDDWDDDKEEETEDSVRGRESILDVMVGQVGKGFAERYLNVHYRSRSESLISFSNHRFYNNRLLTFPNPDQTDAAVRDVYLPNATYDMGRTRTNREEAERVTDIVFELMETQPADESIGVVALSRSQADLIESLIEERRMLSRHLDYRFSEDGAERFFVKNLENVQGDERDHMILSIGYGPTPAGTVPNRFGPINRRGGERRLNVAVTRARMSMTVVHSLRAEDITSTQPGARQLRRYLEYVSNPKLAIESEVTGLGEPESPFEEAVLAALRRRGHRVDAQVGVSGYRIDLAIKSENGVRYVLGIECDGATYHSSPAARDRDWLRQQVLERLGWRIHRVWSTSWIRDPDTEIAAIEQALEQARRDQAHLVRATPSNNFQVESAIPLNIPEPIVVPQRTQQPAPPPHLFDEYRRYEGKARKADLLNVSLSELSDLVRDIINAEQPVHIKTIIDRVRDTYGAPRAGKRIQERVELAIERILDRPRDRTTQFLERTQSLEQLRPRREARRPIDRVAGPEIDEALLLVAKVSFGIEQGDLVRETARQFGWRRTGQEIERRLNEGVERLLKARRLLMQGSMLVAKGDA